MPAINTKVTPPNTLSISNIADKAVEKEAEKFDVQGKGYLTYDELVAFYQAKNSGQLPNIQQLAKFLGMPQHELAVEHLDGYEVLSSQWFAHEWKGDFNIPGLSSDPGYAPAGNVRTGRQIGPQYEPSTNEWKDVDQVVFLLDLNLTKLADFDQRIKGATLVVGPMGFPKEEGAKTAEKVEIPLTLTSQEAYQSHTRFGPGEWVPDKKLIAAQVDAVGLDKLAGGSGGLSFYVRLETIEGKTLYINRDGKPFSDFQISTDELAPAGEA